ncbi:MAG TPA: ATP-binding cassette domain-containing protein [Patescibacteria group bacterium]|nr:ATP-binding cassette domain-containing protein [Patescibacteria group bacterium]
MSSTPDALWSAPSLRVLRPAAVSWTALRRGRLLDGCTLSVPAGMRLLVVGEPEASASLLIRVLAGLSRPRRGRVEIAGLTDPSASGWGRRVAHLGPDPGIPSWMTPREVLALAAGLLDLSSADAARRAESVLAWARIRPEWLDRPVRHGGPPLLQRTALAAALLADPEVVLLDEPLRALEADERTRLLRFPGRRRTVILASRYPASEAGLVSHVALLRDGRVAMLAAVADLEAAGLPLSTRGIDALAERRASTPPPTDVGRPAVASR